MKALLLSALLLGGGWCLARAPAMPAPDESCADGPVPVVWPLGDDGFRPRRLYDSHGQFLDVLHVPNSAFLHQGIDIGACPGEVVYAVEAGKVVYIGGSTDPGADSRHLFVADADDPSASWLYQHLDEIWVGEDAEVVRDQALGTVASFDAAPHFTHVHLQRCVLPGGVGAWLSNRRDGGDPMRWLAARADPQRPEVLPVPASVASAPRLRFFVDGSDVERAEDELAGETLDVVARVRDLFPGDAPLDCTDSPCSMGSSEVDVTPARISFQVLVLEEDPGFPGSPRAVGSSVYSNVIDLSGPLLNPSGAAASVFFAGSKADYDAEREFHVVLTHCLDGTDKPWHVDDGGALLLQLVLEDASGNVAVHELALDLTP